MDAVRFYVIRIISMIIAFLTSLYLFDKVSLLFGHDTFANFLIFIGAYFIISIVLIIIWCYTLTDTLRLKLKCLDEVTVPFMWFYFPIFLIICALYELSIKINKIKTPAD